MNNNKSSMNKKLSDLSHGDKFQWENYTWTVISHTENGTVVLGDTPVTREEKERLETLYGQKLSDLSPEDKLLRAGQTLIWKREKEYIDKAVLIKAIEEADCDVMADYGPEYGTECGFSREAIKNIVQDCPTADVVEVRHGEWIPVDEQYDAFDCSECEAMVSRMMNYCPRCGAKMDGGHKNA